MTSPTSATTDGLSARRHHNLADLNSSLSSPNPDGEAGPHLTVRVSLRGVVEVRER
jgi:hypothetical protein